MREIASTMITLITPGSKTKSTMTASSIVGKLMIASAMRRSRVENAPPLKPA